MIVLGKNYYVTGNHIVVKPIAKIEDNQIITIDRERKNELFPNNGRIYTPTYHQKLTTGNVQIYELEASSTYEKNNESSHYYMVKQTKMNIPLLEVCHVEESFEQEVDKIVEKIRNGFSSEIEMVNEIILHTSDKYILGPFKTNYNAEDRKVQIIDNFEIDKYILPVYDNSRSQLKLASYYDSFDEVQRSFTLTYPEEENFIGELDIATNDYIVREAIRALRGQEEFGDITRRVSQGINEWLKNTTFSEEYNIKRLKRTVELLKEIAPEQEENIYRKYTDELLSLPSIKNIIEEAKEKKFDLEYEKFLKENKDITNENKELTAEHTKLTTKITDNQKQLKRIQQNIEKYTQFMSTKKESMEEEILESYFQQLVINNLSNNHSEQLPFVFNEESFDSTEKYESVDDMRKVFKHNLRLYGERDFQDVIFDYCLIALKFNQPLIIVGDSSFKLAQIIQKTFAASKSQTIIPDATHFSLNVLNEIKSDQRSSFNFTMIHNIHVSSASLNLAGFINAYESKETNNKMIFTFDSFEESKFILEQLKAYSTLDINQRAFFPSPFECSEALTLGQLEYEMLATYVQPVLSYQESQEELLDAIIENDYMENEEDAEVHLKNTFRRVAYTNQFLGNAQKTLSYFLFLEESLREDTDE